MAVERGLACSTGGGTHHALDSYRSGYCLLNDISAAAMIESKLINKVLIVDLHVHQDAEYLRVLKDCLPSVVDTFRPNLVIYDAGVDPHVEDDLGRLNLTDQGLFERDFYVLNLMAKKGIPVATVIGGGYSNDLEILGKRHTLVHRAASKILLDQFV